MTGKNKVPAGTRTARYSSLPEQTATMKGSTMTVWKRLKLFVLLALFEFRVRKQGGTWTTESGAEYPGE